MLTRSRRPRIEFRMPPRINPGDQHTIAAGIEEMTVAVNHIADSATDRGADLQRGTSIEGETGGQRRPA